MAYWHISGWIKWVNPGMIWDRRNDSKILYLTFDDGPTPVVSNNVLDILESRQAKGTFFCLGRNVERHPDVFKEIIRRGHAVGNHSYSHLKGWKTHSREYYEDIALARQFIQSDLFRPPYGQIRRSQIHHLRREYRIIMWEVMSHDYDARVSKERSLKALLRYTKPGSILVFHDSVKAWPKLEFILPRFMDHFSAKGFTFDKLEI